jgi:hypothetical protein
MIEFSIYCGIHPGFQHGYQNSYHPGYRLGYLYRGLTELIHRYLLIALKSVFRKLAFYMLAIQQPLEAIFPANFPPMTFVLGYFIMAKGRSS